jgi:hypothetical protein
MKHLTTIVLSIISLSLLGCGPNESTSDTWTDCRIYFQEDVPVDHELITADLTEWLDNSATGTVTGHWFDGTPGSFEISMVTVSDKLRLTLVESALEYESATERSCRDNYLLYTQFSMSNGVDVTAVGTGGQGSHPLDEAPDEALDEHLGGSGPLTVEGVSKSLIETLQAGSMTSDLSNYDYTLLVQAVLGLGGNIESFRIIASVMVEPDYGIHADFELFTPDNLSYE